MTIQHYENFPVASYLMPAHLRPAVRCIYAFARSADDLADEGDATPQERLQALEKYEEGLAAIASKRDSANTLFKDLGATITAHQLPLQAFSDLLSAFKQDVVVQRYADFDRLLDYCNRSANPVGHIMLHLYRAASKENLRYSDQICTALQLANFWQDVAIDIQKERIYLPQEDLARFGISENAVLQSKITPAFALQREWRDLMQFQVDRTRAMMLAGSPLCKRIPGRLGFELRLVVQGGLRILEKIETMNGDVFIQRPTIRKSDFPILLWRALKM